MQGVATAPRPLPGPNWTPSPDLLRSLPRMLELADVPGLALGVVTDGQVWKGGFGRATLEPVTPVSYETVFEAVSLGKPLFAYAVLRLVDAGRINLDRPLYDDLPSPEANNPLMRKLTPPMCSPTPPVAELEGATRPAAADGRAGDDVQLFGRGVHLPATGGRADNRYTVRPLHVGPDPEPPGNEAQQLHLAAAVRIPQSGGPRSSRGTKWMCIRPLDSMPSIWRGNGKSVLDWRYEDAIGRCRSSIPSGRQCRCTSSPARRARSSPPSAITLASWSAWWLPPSERGLGLSPQPSERC